MHRIVSLKDTMSYVGPNLSGIRQRAREISSDLKNLIRVDVFGTQEVLHADLIREYDVDFSERRKFWVGGQAECNPAAPRAIESSQIIESRSKYVNFDFDS